MGEKLDTLIKTRLFLVLMPPWTLARREELEPRELLELVRQVLEPDDDKLWRLLERVRQVVELVRQVVELVRQVVELVRQVLELVQQVADRVRQVVELILSWSLGSWSRPALRACPS